MDSSTRISDRAAELATLRRRAYGPDAVGSLDPAELARLNHLEESARVARNGRARGLAASDVGSPSDRPADAGAGAGSDLSAASPSAVSQKNGTSQPSEGADSHSELTAAAHAAAGAVAHGVQAESTPSSPAPSTPAWHTLVRSRRVWALVGGAAALGAVVAVGLSNYPWERPDRVLQPRAGVSTAAFTEYSDWFSGLNIRLDTLQAFQAEGDLRPWIAQRIGGGSCLLLVRNEQAMANLGCAGRGIDPIIDLLPGIGVDDSQPDGGTVRYIGRGNTVEVWISAPDEETQLSERAPGM